MKYLIVVALICCSVGIAYAWDDDTYEIKPKYTDFTPNDGFMDAGTRSNPYVMENDSGNTIATIQPKYTDFDSNDGFMDAGSRSNPYVVKYGD